LWIPAILTEKFQVPEVDREQVWPDGLLLVSRQDRREMMELQENRGLLSVYGGRRGLQGVSQEKAYSIAEDRLGQEPEKKVSAPPCG
jgi:hypothetical protein